MPTPATNAGWRFPTASSTARSSIRWRAAKTFSTASTATPRCPSCSAPWRATCATGNEADGAAARFFWDQVALHHSFATGGHGKDEYFGPPDELNARIDGRTAESCNVYNMLKMTRQLFALKPDIRYAEFQERALFNHVLGSIDPQEGWTCYMVPVGRGVQREYERNMLDGGFTCCVGTGMESHALHGDGIYYEAGDRLWVNLYVPSTADWKAAGDETGDGDRLSRRRIGEAETDASDRRGNSPSPCGALPGPARVLMSRSMAHPVGDLPRPGSYVELKRTWTSGDTVAWSCRRGSAWSRWPTTRIASHCCGVPWCWPAICSRKTDEKRKPRRDLGATGRRCPCSWRRASPWRSG